MHIYTTCRYSIFYPWSIHWHSREVISVHQSYSSNLHCGLSNIDHILRTSSIFWTSDRKKHIQLSSFSFYCNISTVQAEVTEMCNYLGCLFHGIFRTGWKCWLISIALGCVYVVDINLIILSVYKAHCTSAFPSKEDSPEGANVFYVLVKLIWYHRVAPRKLK